MPYLNMNCMKIIENLKMQYILLNPVEKSNFGSKNYSKKIKNGGGYIYKIFENGKNVVT